MKYLLFILATLVIGFLTQLVLPWWSIALVAAVLSFAFKLSPNRSALAGLIAAALLWGIYAVYLNAANDGILAARMGKVFGGLNGATVILVTALMGGIFGGLGALTGSLGRGTRVEGRG
jgi:hypothetical protein